MVQSVSLTIVWLFGVLILVLSLWGIYAPAKLLGMVRGVMDRSTGLYAAVVSRLALGLALILAADASRFPHVFTVVGWIAIVAAIGLLLVGRERLRRFIAWFDRCSPTLIRLWLLLGIGFGGLLVYGAL